MAYSHGQVQYIGLWPIHTVRYSTLAYGLFTQSGIVYWLMAHSHNQVRDGGGGFFLAREDLGRNSLRFFSFFFSTGDSLMHSYSTL